MTDINHWEEMMGYMEERMLWAEKVVPHLLCSWGAHIANLRQQEYIMLHGVEDAEARVPIWFVMGEPEALGLGALIVSPSGFMKTYPMKILLGSVNNPGLLPVKTGWGGMITEAGFVGTVYPGEDGGKMLPGMAFDFRQGVVAWDEASNVLSKEKAENNVDLVNALIKAIGDSFVTKRLSGGQLEYWTCITIWLATQPKRLYMVGGLNRRVLKAVPAWRQKHVEELKLARDDRGRDGRWDPSNKEKIRNGLADLMEAFDPHEVVVSEATMDWLNSHTKNHFEKALMERALFGKKVLTNGYDTILELNMDTEDKKMIKAFLHDQRMIEMGAGIQLIYQTLNKPMTRKALWEAFQTFSDEWDSFKGSLAEAISREIIKVGTDHETGTKYLMRA